MHLLIFYMIFIRDINPLSLKLLERIYRQSRHHQVRQRAHCLILAASGKKMKELIRIFQVSYKTIYNWFERWELEGIVGLYNKPGRGSKRTFSDEQEKRIKEWVDEEPRQLKKVLQKVKEEWQIEVSTKTIKRIIKNLSLSLASNAPRCWWRTRPYRIQGKEGTTRRV